METDISYFGQASGTLRRILQFTVVLDERPDLFGCSPLRRRLVVLQHCSPSPSDALPHLMNRIRDGAIRTLVRMLRSAPASSSASAVAAWWDANTSAVKPDCERQHRTHGGLHKFTTQT
jgi:hypothetical protein